MHKRIKRIVITAVFFIFISAFLFSMSINPYIFRHSESQKKQKRLFPDTVVTEAVSPERVLKAQILKDPDGRNYYLNIVNRRHQTSYLLNRNLVPVKGKREPEFRIAWRGYRTVLLEIDNGSEKNFEYYLYDTLYMNFEKLDQVPPELIPDKEKEVADLGVIKLDTDEDKLALFKNIVPGIDYMSLKNALPELSRLFSETQSERLSEAFLNLTILNYPFNVEFNFRDKKLYNFFYTAGTSDTETADEIYKTFQAYFTSKYGNYKEETVQEEPGLTVKSSLWEEGPVKAAIYNNISSGGSTLVISVGGR